MKRILGVITLLVFAVLLVACAPKDTEAAAAKMKKAGYIATASVASEVKEDGYVGQVTGTKDSLSEALSSAYTAQLYKTAKQAKAAYEKTQDAEGKSSATLVGKWVFYGNEDALKAFKK
ncbi:MAG: hypothetical protein J6X93_00675 [Bacilli bacterium]|nr:hypothetical protein [Bacilli bacterium]